MKPLEKEAVKLYYEEFMRPFNKMYFALPGKNRHSFRVCGFNIYYYFNGKLIFKEPISDITGSYELFDDEEL